MKRICVPFVVWSWDASVWRMIIPLVCPRPDGSNEGRLDMKYSTQKNEQKTGFRAALIASVAALSLGAPVAYEFMVT